MGGGLDPFFYPDTVAVVGASGKPGSFSHELLRNLARSFRGRVYAVNPKYTSIAGVPSYPNIKDVPGPVDLAVIALPAPKVPAAVEEAGEAGVPAVIVVAGGFAEVGGEGERLQEELLRAARRHGVRVVGPNCIGVYNAVNGLDTFFLPREKMRRPPKGYIGVVSQSGAFLTTLMDWLAAEGVGIVKAINIGNKVDVDEAEVIEYYTGREEINTIMVYIEGVSPGRGRALVEAIRRAREAGKRVVVLKGGKTRLGARAARSHTAALAGEYEVFHAAMWEAGAHEASGPTDFVDAAKALTLQGRLGKGGRRVLVVTNAGGPGVLASDELARLGLDMPPTPRDVVEYLRERLPPIVALGNPIDLTGDAKDDDFELVLSRLAGREEYDALLVIAPVQPATMTARVAEIIAGWAWRAKKPTVAVTIGAEYGETVKAYMDSLGVPAYPLPDRAARALASILYSSRTPCPWGKAGTPPAEARRIIEAALSEDRRVLAVHEALALLEAYGVPVAPYCLAGTPREARECAGRLRGPLAAKIVSPDILHKTDVGGVMLGVEPGQADRAYEAIVERIKGRVPGARIMGVIFQEMVEGLVEAIVGARRDPGFGPVSLVGLGGVAVEVLRDYQVGLAPLSGCRAREMIEGLRSKPLLEGARGRPRADREALADVLVRVSRLIAENPEVEEVDVNPVMVLEEGAVAVDARVILSPPGPRP